jgi:hypothetical protein
VAAGRPAAYRIEAADRVQFAALAEAALACGWRYGVVSGWRPHVMTALETLSAQRRPLNDPPGLARALLAGTLQVRELEPDADRVLLRSDDGQELATTVRALVSRDDCRPAPDAGASLPHSRGRQPAGLEDLTARQRDLVASRYAHLMETETGYRSGSPLYALPGEPRVAYDPAVTTLHQRRVAKVAEMATWGPIRLRCWPGPDQRAHPGPVGRAVPPVRDRRIHRRALAAAKRRPLLPSSTSPTRLPSSCAARASRQHSSPFRRAPLPGMITRFWSPCGAGARKTAAWLAASSAASSPICCQLGQNLNCEAP